MAQGGSEAREGGAGDLGGAPLRGGRWAGPNWTPPALPLQAWGPKPPSGPLIGAPAGHSQLLIGGEGAAGQEELGAEGAAGGRRLGPSAAGGPLAGPAALVQGEELTKHVRDERQPLVQLRHLRRQERVRRGPPGARCR